MPKFDDFGRELLGPRSNVEKIREALGAGPYTARISDDSNARTGEKRDRWIALIIGKGGVKQIQATGFASEKSIRNWLGKLGVALRDIEVR